MLAKVYTLKRPKTNVQIIQQSVLLKYKYYMRFLRLHGTDVYMEVRGVNRKAEKRNRKQPPAGHGGKGVGAEGTRLWGEGCVQQRALFALARHVHGGKEMGAYGRGGALGSRCKAYLFAAGHQMYPGTQRTKGGTCLRTCLRTRRRLVSSCPFLLPLSAQIRNEYVGVLSRILSSHFKTYLGAMDKMHAAVAGQGDVLGAPEGGGAAAGLSSLFAKSAARPTTVRGGGTRQP